MLVTGGLGKSTGALSLRGMGGLALVVAPPVSPPVPGSGVVLRRGRAPAAHQATIRISVRLVQKNAQVSAQAHILPSLRLSAALMQSVPSVSASVEIIDELPIIISLI